MTRRTPVLLYIIIALAGIGLFSWIIKEPGHLIKYLLITASVGAVIFFIARAIIRRRSGGANHNEMRKYRQAVKQSQRKYKQIKPNTNQMRPQKQMKRKRKKPSHLTVIKGNKSAKKNNDDRASN